jgi:acetyl-CoA acetyltransferase
VAHQVRLGLETEIVNEGNLPLRATWRDGKVPVNVSGGLESKGHPIAATGIANIWEVCHHLRGEPKDRQIEGAKVGLAHVIGLGSACGVHILEAAA